MKEVQKIVITGSSGWGMDVEAYQERLTLTDHSISFKHVPEKIEEELISQRPFWNHEVQWSYKAQSQSFVDGYQHVTELIANLFKPDPDQLICTDVGSTVFTVTYEDGQKDKVEFWYADDLFDPIWKAIRQLIPPVQEMPILLQLPEDEEDDFDEDDD